MTTSCKIAFKAGEVISNKWVIREFIGKGSMGENYRAHQANLNRDVAIKVITREWIESIEERDKEIETVAQRFKRKVLAMAQIRHPNVVQILDHDSVSIFQCGQYLPVEFIVMEYTSGNSLQATMPERGLHPEESAVKVWMTKYFMPILDGVEELHRHDVAHCDLRPDNIFIDHDVPKIALGLSLSSKLYPVKPSDRLNSSPNESTPKHFKIPDQFTDIYALAQILLEAVSGKVKPETVSDKGVKLTENESPFFQELFRIIQMATAQSRDERIESVQCLRSQLKRLVNELDIQAQLAYSSNVERNVKPVPLRSYSKIIWSIVVATLSVVLLTFWHFQRAPNFMMTKGISTGGEPHYPMSGQGVTAGIPNKTGIEYREKQRYISGGELLLPKTITRGKGETVQVTPFYMDEFFVTNQQFIDFLNQNLARISIESSVVKGDGANWLLLGEVRAEYEPIIYQNGAFYLSDPGHASSPVLRVTSFGASAFATYVGGRLPTEVELFYVIIKGTANLQSGTKDSSANTTGQLRVPEEKDEKNTDANDTGNTDDLYRPNSLGIKGLNKEIGEWVLKIANNRSIDHMKVNRYAVIGGTEGAPKNGSPYPSLVDRIPWEGCEDVGFRTVRNVDR
jgi:serine/threonine-protein kinase